MTDQKQFLNLMSKFGINYEVIDKRDDLIHLRIAEQTENYQPLNSKVKGWRDFYTEYIFTTDGQFVEIGIWE